MIVLKPGRSALAAATLVFFFPVASHAALYAVDLDGINGHDAVYDSVLDITWLADANYAGAQLDWHGAEAFIAAMNLENLGAGHLGVNTWRQTTNSGCQGYGCGRTDTDPSTDTNALHDTDDELGYHYYQNFESAQFKGMIHGSNTTNIALFSNIQEDGYWTGTEVTGASPLLLPSAYRFNNTGLPSLSGNAGSYGTNVKTGLGTRYVWAVADGNVGGASVVPVPAAAWLFGSALTGLGLLRQASGRSDSVS